MQLHHRKPLRKSNSKIFQLLKMGNMEFYYEKPLQKLYLENL